MPLKEKSAWVTCMSLILGAVYYSNALLTNSVRGEGIQLTELFIVYVFIVVIASIVGNIVVAVTTAITSAEDAMAKADERDKLISTRSNSLSAYFLGFGAVTGLLHYLYSGNGDMLFHIVFVSLTLSAIAEYILQIYFYRRGV